MLDENLPAFHIRPSSDDQLQSTVYLGQGGLELNPEYTIRRPNPIAPASKNCYAVALYDSYNPEVLYAEVLVQPEWSQPTLSQAEIRANNGLSPPPIPIVPNNFTIQLYNPDQQVSVKQIAGSWNSSSYWEFDMPQQTFRRPSASMLDRTQDDPAVSAVTPKVTFKWKKDSKLSKDITCYLAGKSTDGKKSKEPDITIAMFRKGKELTLYQPNMHRVEVEDMKGLEVVILLGAVVIRDTFFEASKEMFNIDTASLQGVRRASGPNKHTPSPPPGGAAIVGYPGVFPLDHPSSSMPPPARVPSVPIGGPPKTHAQYQIDQETARLRAQEEAAKAERERQDRKEQKRIKKMLEEEERQRARREAEVEKETERLRKQYGINPVPDNCVPPRPTVHFSPPLPARPQQHVQGPPAPQRPQAYGQQSNQSRMNLYNQAKPLPPQQLPQYFSAPHSRPNPAPRPQSVPAERPHGPFHCQTLNNVSSPNHSIILKVMLIYPRSGPMSSDQSHHATRKTGANLKAVHLLTCSSQVAVVQVQA